MEADPRELSQLPLPTLRNDRRSRARWCFQAEMLNAGQGWFVFLVVGFFTGLLAGMIQGPPQFPLALLPFKVLVLSFTLALLPFWGSMLTCLATVAREWAFDIKFGYSISPSSFSACSTAWASCNYVEQRKEKKKKETKKKRKRTEDGRSGADAGRAARRYCSEGGFWNSRKECCRISKDEDSCWQW